MKGLGLGYLKFHVCSGLGVVCLEFAEVLAFSFESPGSHSASILPPFLHLKYFKFHFSN